MLINRRGNYPILQLIKGFLINKVYTSATIHCFGGTDREGVYIEVGIRRAGLI